MKDIALHVLDLVQNSIAAHAQLIEIYIEEQVDRNRYLLRIKDNGKGMSEDLLQRVIDPYTTTRTSRKVGMGIPLLKHNVDATGGAFEITSTLGKGTDLKAFFVLNHIDRIPLGAIADVIVMTCTMNPNLDLVYSHSSAHGIYVFDTREIKLELEGVSIAEPAIGLALKEMIRENLAEIEVLQ